MKVGLLTLHLFLPVVSSLKEKRSIVKGIVAAVERHGPAFAVAEVNDLDVHNRATIRIAHLSNNRRYTESALTRLRSALECGRDYTVEGYEVEII